MSKPIAYASLALDELLKKYGITLRSDLLENMTVTAVRGFLDDAYREGRFDMATINQLLDDLK